MQKPPSLKLVYLDHHYWRAECVRVACHIADLPLDTLLVVKDLNAPVATAVLFGCTVLCWLCLRCIYYPLYVVRTALRSSSACDDLGCVAACAGLLLILAADCWATTTQGALTAAPPPRPLVASPACHWWIA